MSRSAASDVSVSDRCCCCCCWCDDARVNAITSLTVWFMSARVMSSSCCEPGTDENAVRVSRMCRCSCDHNEPHWRASSSLPPVICDTSQIAVHNQASYVYKVLSQWCTMSRLQRVDHMWSVTGCLSYPACNVSLRHRRLDNNLPRDQKYSKIMKLYALLSCSLELFQVACTSSFEREHTAQLSKINNAWPVVTSSPCCVVCG